MNGGSRLRQEAVELVSYAQRQLGVDPRQVICRVCQVYPIRFVPTRVWVIRDRTMEFDSCSVRHLK